MIGLDESVAKYYILKRLQSEITRYKEAITNFSMVFTRSILQIRGVDEKVIDLLQKNYRSIKPYTYTLSLADTYKVCSLYKNVADSLNYSQFISTRDNIYIKTGYEVNLSLLGLAGGTRLISDLLEGLLKNPNYKSSIEDALKDVFKYRCLMFKALCRYPIDVLGLVPKKGVRIINSEVVYNDTDFLSGMSQRKLDWDYLRELDPDLYDKVSEFLCNESKIDKTIINIINSILDS